MELNANEAIHLFVHTQQVNIYHPLLSTFDDNVIKTQLSL